MRILVTRAADQARATAIRLAALGHEAVLAPLTALVLDREVALPHAGVAALVATSTNAVEALGGRADLADLRPIPMFVVGARTARAARALGFACVISADGDRTDLVARLTADLAPGPGKPPMRLLWLAGRDRTDTFAEDLRARGFVVDVAEVYRAEEGGPLGDDIAADLDAGRIDAIAVYSPRSGNLLLTALLARGFSPSSKRPTIHAISEAAAGAFRAAGWPEVIVASRPDEAALLATFGSPMGTVPLGETDDGRSAVSTGDEARNPPMASKRNRTGSDTTPETGAPSEEMGETAVESARDAVAEPAAEAPPPAPTEEPAVTRDEAVVATATESADVALPSDEALAASEPTPEPTTDAPAPTLDEAPESMTAAPTAEIDAPSAPLSEPSTATASAPEPIPAPAAPVPASSGAKGLVAATVVAALLGGGLGVGGSAFLASRGGGDRAALEAKVGALEAKLAKTAETETRLAAIEASLAAVKPIDVTPLEKRLADIEKAPALTLPADASARLSEAGARLAALEEAARARLEAAKTSVADTVAALPQGAQNPALADFAAKVDAALVAAREDTATRTAQLDAKIGAIVGAAADRATLETLRASVVDTFNRMGAEVDRRTAETVAALDGMRQRLGGLESMRGDVDGLVGRLGGLETVTKEAKTDRDRVAETIEVTRSKTESRVGSVENKVAALEAGAAEAREAQARAVLAVALADLKSAVDTGRPFRAELDVVKAASAAAPLDLGPLDGFADKGVPTVAALRDRLHAVTRAMHEADETATAGPSWSDRLLAHAGNLVRVRPVGDKGGTDLGALVSRVEARMVAGDLAGALTAWKALPETARRTSADWGAALEARVAVDTALSTATTAAVSKLTPTRP